MAKYTKMGTKSGVNTGITDAIRELKGTDINKMSGEDLYKYTRAAQKAVNDNYRRVKAKYGRAIPAVRGLEETGGPITLKGLRHKKKGTYSYNVNKLRHELVRARNYLNTKTGTMTGAKKYEATLDDYIPGYSDMTEAQKKEYWKYIDELRASGEFEIAAYEIGSGDTLSQMFEIYRGSGMVRHRQTPDQIIDEMKKRVVDVYEKAVRSPEDINWI